MKRGDTIWEMFTVAPRNYLLLDNKRSIFQKLWTMRNTHAIHKNGYRLLQILVGKWQCVYIYEFDKTLKMPKIMETIVINYVPFLGKKTCAKCQHLKRGYCTMKGKKLMKYSYYRCLYWVERDGLTNVSKQTKTERDGSSDAGVSGHNRVRNTPISTQQYYNEQVLYTVCGFDY